MNVGNDQQHDRPHGGELHPSGRRWRRRQADKIAGDKSASGNEEHETSRPGRWRRSSTTIGRRRREAGLRSRNQPTPAAIDIHQPKESCFRPLWELAPGSRPGHACGLGGETRTAGKRRCARPQSPTRQKYSMDLLHHSLSPTLFGRTMPSFSIVAGSCNRLGGFGASVGGLAAQFIVRTARTWERPGRRTAGAGGAAAQRRQRRPDTVVPSPIRRIGPAAVVATERDPVLKLRLAGLHPEPDRAGRTLGGRATGDRARNGLSQPQSIAFQAWTSGIRPVGATEHRVGWLERLLDDEAER